MIDWSKIKYFKPEEFSQPDKLRDGVIYALDVVRKKFGKGLVITSSFRASSQNLMAGGVENSAHCLAPDGFYSGIDFAPVEGMTDRNKFIMLKILQSEFFVRIGIYKRHFHVDIETRLTQNVLWISDSN